MDLDINEVENRHFGVLVGAINIESKVLSIWTAQIPQNLYFHQVCLSDVPRKSRKSDNPYWPLKGIPIGRLKGSLLACVFTYHAWSIREQVLEIMAEVERVHRPEVKQKRPDE